MRIQQLLPTATLIVSALVLSTPVSALEISADGEDLLRYKNVRFPQGEPETTATGGLVVTPDANDNIVFLDWAIVPEKTVVEDTAITIDFDWAARDATDLMIGLWDGTNSAQLADLGAVRNGIAGGDRTVRQDDMTSDGNTFDFDPTPPPNALLYYVDTFGGVFPTGDPLTEGVTTLVISLLDGMADLTIIDPIQQQNGPYRTPFDRTQELRVLFGVGEPIFGASARGMSAAASPSGMILNSISADSALFDDPDVLAFATASRDSVPEPATVVLVSLGVAGIGCLRRRKQSG